MSDWNDSSSSCTSTAPSNVDPAQVRATLPLATTLASVAKKLLGALGVSIISHAVQMDPALCKSLDWPSPDDLAPAYAAAARSGGLGPTHRSSTPCECRGTARTTPISLRTPACSRAVEDVLPVVHCPAK